MEGLKAEVAGKQQAEEERWAQEEQARQEAERQEQERLQAELERARRATEEEQRLRRAMEEEEAALEEKRAQEERAFALEAQRQEAEAAAKEKAETEAAQKTVDDFLKARGFKNLRTPRKAFCGASIYPLHLAVEENKEDTVRALLRRGADKTQKNSSKLSPLELAQKLNKNGSHDAIVKLLRA